MPVHVDAFTVDNILILYRACIALTWRNIGSWVERKIQLLLYLILWCAIHLICIALYIRFHNPHSSRGL